MRIPGPVIAVFVGTVVMWTLVANWGGGKACHKNQYTDKENCAQYSTLPFILVRITETLDHHEGTVVGIGTVFVAIFTFFLVRSTNKLWASSRENFIAANPPILIARRFRLHARTAERPPGIEFILANEGRGTAYIELDIIGNDIRITGEMHQLEQGSFPVYRGGQNILENREYPPTKRRAQFVALKGQLGDNVLDENIQKVLVGDAGFVFCGMIRYKDSADGLFELRFFRTFERGQRFLRAHPDPDYDSEGQKDHPKYNEWEMTITA
jgi:hypothetical protein